MKILAALILAISPLTLLAHGAHTHGVGQLGIVVEESQLILLLELPQHDVVGFERAPRNAREQLTVQAALEKLRQPAKLLLPTPAAQCELQEQKIDAPLLEGGKGQHGHGDIEVRYVYRCAQPAALLDVKSSVAAEFPRVRSLQVSFSGPKGQKAGRLDAKNPVFAW